MSNVLTTIPLNDGTRTSASFLQIGAKKTGKTQSTLNIMADMIRRRGVPILIFDNALQAEYEVFLPILIGEIPHWDQIWPHARLPVFRCRTRDALLFFEYVYEYVRNSLVVFEDCTNYLTGNMPMVMKDVILQCKNHGNDLVFNTHSIRSAAPFVLEQCEYYILRQTPDDPYRLPAKVPHPHRVREAMLEIMEENEGKELKLAYRLLKTQEL